MQSNRKRRVVLSAVGHLLTVFMLIAGCAATREPLSTKWSRLSYINDIRGDYDEVWQAVVTALEREKVPVAVADRELGVIISDSELHATALSVPAGVELSPATKALVVIVVTKLSPVATRLEALVYSVRPYEDGAMFQSGIDEIGTTHGWIKNVETEVRAMVEAKTQP